MKRIGGIFITLSIISCSSPRVLEGIEFKQTPSAIAQVFKPPKADADPSVRDTQTFAVPTTLIFSRTDSNIDVSIDEDTYVDTLLTVGREMITGFYCRTYFIQNGQTRGPSISLTDGPRPGCSFFSRSSSHGFPIEGESYIIELVIELFETDIPAQHMWNPKSANYRVLWVDTLRTGEI